MTKYIKYILIFFCGLILGFTLNYFLPVKKLDIPEVLETRNLKENTLTKYSIEDLKWDDLRTGTLKINDIIKDDEEYISYSFSFKFNPNLDGKTNKTTTGQINVPKKSDIAGIEGPYPVIIMFRGYVNQSTYRTGDGTRNAAAYYAKNGFITVAPDFLGYGDSDSESGNIFETRFQTYTTALTLMKTLEYLTQNLNSLNNIPELKDKISSNSKIFIWGHSNGGQIALTALEVSGKPYPTVLWAPVSKPFPYSVLYYTDESEDRGKLIRRELSKFEENYDVEKYSLINYIDRLNAPIELHQGALDDAVPIGWSNDLADLLSAQKKEFKYYKYPGTDHNLRPMWDSVVARNLEFYNSYLTQ